MVGGRVRRYEAARFTLLFFSGLPTLFAAEPAFHKTPRSGYPYSEADASDEHDEVPSGRTELHELLGLVNGFAAQISRDNLGIQNRANRNDHNVIRQDHEIGPFAYFEAANFVLHEPCVRGI